MTERSRLGIIGLGRQWRRFRAALRATGGVVVTAVSDPVLERAERAARRMGCGVAEGAGDLVSRPEGGSVLGLGRAWYGAWPVESARRVGKPVLAVGVPLSLKEPESWRTSA